MCTWYAVTVGRRPQGGRLHMHLAQSPTSPAIRRARCEVPGGSDLLPPPACLLLLALRRTLLAMSKDDRRGLDVGSFIRQQRERANISLRKLADKAGISNPYLSQIERGLRKPSAEILKSIARGLSIQAESLYQRAGLLDEGFDPPSVIEAIESDAQLNQRQKRVLLDIYRTYVQEEEEE